MHVDPEGLADDVPVVAVDVYPLEGLEQKMVLREAAPNTIDERRDLRSLTIRIQNPAADELDDQPLADLHVLKQTVYQYTIILLNYSFNPNAQKYDAKASHCNTTHSMSITYLFSGAL